MQTVIDELKALASKYKVTFPKSTPMTEQELADYQAYMDDPSRFIDYIGTIR